MMKLITQPTSAANRPAAISPVIGSPQPALAISPAQ